MSDQHLVVGLIGKAGTGKTTVANAIVPQSSMGRVGDDLDADNRSPAEYNHLFFSLPLYEMASIRTGTEGMMASDRMKYAIHDVLLRLFGGSPIFGAPSYDRLVEMVEEIVGISVPLDGSKPREFLQKVGTDICRAWDPDVWVKWMRRKIASDYFQAMQEHADRPYAPDFITVVSDVRFMNEVELIREYPHYLLVKLICDEDVRQERIASRDEFEQVHDDHISEEELEHFVADDVVTINTTDMEAHVVAQAVYTLINQSLAGDTYYDQERHD